MLDAYPLVAFLRREPVATEVRSLLRREEVGIPSINLAEAIDQLLRIDLADRSAIEQTLASLSEDRLLSVLVLDEALALEGAVLRARHYHRSARPLSIPDCILLASARRLAAAAVTSDPAIAETARLEQIGLIPLPDSQGRRP